MKSITKYQISSLLQCLLHFYADSFCIAYTGYEALRTITHLYAIATYLLLFFIFIVLLKKFPTNLMSTQLPFLFLRLYFLCCLSNISIYLAFSHRGNLKH